MQFGWDFGATLNQSNGDRFDSEAPLDNKEKLTNAVSQGFFPNKKKLLCIL
jgi:hypothetical protein